MLFRSLPVATVIEIAPSGIVAGVAIGLASALLFALIPLLALRRIAPLLALRAAFDADRRGKDPWVIATYGIIGALLVALAVATTGSISHGVIFTAGVLAVFALLALCAQVSRALMRRLAPRVLSFSWRQGLANLYRPNNQTLALTLAIGLGAFLLVTIYSVQTMLVQQVLRRNGAGDGNLVLFDVQNDQRQDIADLLRSFEIPIQADVPIVTMRLTAVKGRKVDELRADTSAGIPHWALRREYRSSYRDRKSVV